MAPFGAPRMCTRLAALVTLSLLVLSLFSQFGPGFSQFELEGCSKGCQALGAASPSAASPSTASPSTASPSAASPSVASPSAVSPSAASPSVASTSAVSVRLPQNVRPKKYRVQLEPNLGDFTFSGSVSVELDVVEATREIEFHSSELEIHKAVLEAGERKVEAGAGGVPTVTLDKARERATFSLGADAPPLPPGPAILTLNYSGVLNDNLVGFYKSSFTLNGTTHYIATAKNEPIGARKALPCWDEPALKAVFSVSLVVPKGMIGLANMPEKAHEERPDGSSLVHFEDTPIMSTYLLVFIVGNFDKLSNKTSTGLEVNVYTTLGKQEQGRYALECATKILPFYNNYFGIDYPLPKADLIGIPDFQSGAQENWGLIAFRESGLLVDPATATGKTLMDVTINVVHELAHQWFGNLVTMKWWDDLWLNEGFATWMSYVGADYLHPDWDIWTQFVTANLATGMVPDALLGSHPLQVPINDPSKMGQVFDAITYFKGASVVRQVEAAIGSKPFTKGLHDYLDKYKYSNTVTNDLWASLEGASGKPVKDMMSRWTSQKGYPVVTVSEPAGGAPGLALRQTRFLVKGPPSAEEDDKLWYVSINATTGVPGSTDITSLPPFALSTKEAVAHEFVVPPGAWIRLNTGSTGIFRVNYTPSQWDALGKAVQNLSLPTIDRLGLAIDVLALAEAGHLGTAQALSFMFLFKKETEYPVWVILDANFEDIDIAVSVLGQREALEKAGQELFRPIAEKLGWDPKPGESYMDGMLRPLVLTRLGKYKDSATVDKCKQLFASLQTDIKSVTPNMQLCVMGTAVRNGGKEEVEAVKKLYQGATDAAFKQNCLSAMSQTKDKGLFKEFLDWALDEANVKTQDQGTVFSLMANNPENRDFAWDYFKEHFQSIQKRFGSSPILFKTLPADPLKGFATDEKADDAEKFYSANPVPMGAMELQRTIETIRSRAIWVKRDGDSIKKWLNDKAELYGLSFCTKSTCAFS